MIIKNKSTQNNLRQCLNFYIYILLLLFNARRCLIIYVCMCDTVRRCLIISKRMCDTVRRCLIISQCMCDTARRCLIT